MKVIFAGMSKLTAPLGRKPLKRRIKAGRKDARPAAPGTRRGPKKKLPLVGIQRKWVFFFLGIRKRNLMTDQGDRFCRQI